MRYVISAVLILSFFSFTFISCGNPYVVQSLQDQSTGQIPCPADNIEVIEHKIDDNGNATWTALCEGRTYSCEREGGQSGTVTCSEMESQMPE